MLPNYLELKRRGNIKQKILETIWSHSFYLICFKLIPAKGSWGGKCTERLAPQQSMVKVLWFQNFFLPFSMRGIKCGYVGSLIYRVCAIRIFTRWHFSMCGHWWSCDWFCARAVGSESQKAGSVCEMWDTVRGRLYTPTRCSHGVLCCTNISS